jgi:hypothetical protein
MSLLIKGNSPHRQRASARRHFRHGRRAAAARAFAAPSLTAHEARRLASWRRWMKPRALAAHEARQLALGEERGDLTCAVAAE